MDQSGARSGGFEDARTRGLHDGAATQMAAVIGVPDLRPIAYPSSKVTLKVSREIIGGWITDTLNWQERELSTLFRTPVVHGSCDPPSFELLCSGHRPCRLD